MDKFCHIIGTVIRKVLNNVDGHSDETNWQSRAGGLIRLKMGEILSESVTSFAVVQEWHFPCILKTKIRALIQGIPL